MMLLAIDPGVNAAGWALLTRCIRLSNLAGYPLIVDAGVVKASKSKSKVNRAMLLADEICTHMEKAPIGRVVTEWPQLRADAVSYSAAARGDLQMLALMAGAVMALARARAWRDNKQKLKCELVTVSEWKGQLSKSVVARRLSRFFGSPIGASSGVVVASHAIDAVGVGCHALGFPLDCDLWRRQR